MVGWLTAIALAMTMAVVAVYPSYFWLRAFRIPAYVAGVLAPSVTVGILVGLGFLYHALGIFWSGARVIPALLLIGVGGVALHVRRFRFRVRNPWGLSFWLAVAGGFLLAALPMFLSGPPTNPVQQWDPSFHMNGVWVINHVGDGQLGTGLEQAFPEGSPSNYPLGWHIFTALFTTPATVVFGANASTLALILLWVVGAGVYTRVLFPSKPAWIAAPVIAGGMLSMPGDALMAYSQWPNAAAVAFLPGIASLLVLLGRQLLRGAGGVRPRRLRRFGLQSLALLVALLGTVVVHPASAFNLLVLLGPAVLAGAYRMIVAFVRRRLYAPAVGVGLLVILGFVVVYLVMEAPQVRSMGEYPRSGVSWSVAFANILTPTPPYASSLSLALWVGVLAALLCVGIYAAWAGFKRHGWPTWPVWSLIAFAFLVLISYAPDSAFRQWLVAPWYLDPRRIMEAENLAMIPLAALGFAQLADWVSEAVPKLASRRSAGALIAIVLLVASGGEGLTARTAAARSVYDPDSLGKPGMATAGELEMLQSLDELLPEDSLILGDPQNGSVYVQAIGQRRVYFPALTLGTNPTDNETTLVQRFNRIGEDPEVCRAVLEEGITHFYADDDGYYFSRLRSDRTPGLYDVDTSTGFELVAQGDTARLYRITACD